MRLARLTPASAAGQAEGQALGVWPTRPTPIIVHSRSSGAPQTAGSNRAPSGADDCSHTDPRALGPGDTVRPGKSAAAGGSRSGRAGSAVQLWEEQGGPSGLLGAVLPLLRPGQSDQRRRRRQQKRRRRRSSTSATQTKTAAAAMPGSSAVVAEKWLSLHPDSYSG